MFLPWEVIVFIAFAFITLIQLLYYACIFSRLAFYKKDPKLQSQQHPVSVIVCAKNENENLSRNLPDLLVQQYATTHEVIVVNDNSTDDSTNILSSLQKKFKRLRVIELSQEA